MKSQLSLALLLVVLIGSTASLVAAINVQPAQANTASELAAIAKRAADKARQNRREGQNDRKRTEPANGRR